MNGASRAVCDPSRHPKPFCWPLVYQWCSMQTVDICVETYQVFIGGFFCFCFCFFVHSLPMPEFKIYYALGREWLAKDMGKN